MATKYSIKMIFFLKISYLKDNSYINNNVDDEQLKQMLARTQNVHVAEILGNKFYKHLLEQVEAETLTAEEDTLIKDYLRPLIITIVELKALSFLRSQIRKKTVGQNKDEYMESGSSKDIRQELNAERTKFENNLKDYLHENASYFPLYIGKNRRNYNINISFI